METMPKAIFVDFDGTLVDSVPALWKCYNLFLSMHGISGSNEEFTSLMGPPIREIVSQLRQKHHLEPSVEALVLQYEKIVQAAYTTHTVVFPWAIDILQKQKSEGARLAIVTAAPIQLVQPVLISYEIENLFEAVFSCSLGEPSKPHPAIYLRALSEMRLQPHEVVVVEDSSSGIKSAQSAGLAVIVFDPTNSNQGLMNDLPVAHSWQRVEEMIHSKFSSPISED